MKNATESCVSRLASVRDRTPVQIRAVALRMVRGTLMSPEFVSANVGKVHNQRFIANPPIRVSFAGKKSRT